MNLILGENLKMAPNCTTPQGCLVSVVNGHVVIFGLELKEEGKRPDMNKPQSVTSVTMLKVGEARGLAGAIAQACEMIESGRAGEQLDP